jgi:thiamine-phosphate pyrophosphorylase
MSAVPYIYVITDGTACDAGFKDHRDRIIGHVVAAAASGATHFQLREKQLSAARLFELAKEAVRAAAGTGLKVLVNDRVDVAVAARADGVHLTSRSFSAAAVRSRFGRDILIAVSAHEANEILKAREQGADMAVFGPVFETPGKTAAGIGKLREACEKAAGFPVIAIGGIDVSNVRKARAAGAAGVAGIRSMSDAGVIATMAAELKK